MSSRPGFTLESYVMWNHDLIVDGDTSANLSVSIAEACGTSTRNRKQLAAAEFTPMLNVYEPFREQVEHALSEFDDDNQSWRDYSGYAFDFIPRDVFAKAEAVISKNNPVHLFNWTRLQLLGAIHADTIRSRCTARTTTRQSCSP